MAAGSLHRSLPKWDDLPSMPGHPEIKGCAWSVWGDDDELGTINLLTPSVVLAAAKEIQTGRSVRLDWPLNYPERPGLHRQAFRHTIIERPSGARDDELTFNPQSGSQIDGLRHYGHLDLDTWYGGARGSELFAAGQRKVTTDTATEPRNSRLSIHHWAQHGIQGRGVLIDFQHFAPQIDFPDFHAFKHQAITAEHIRAVARREGVEFRQGDILIVRTGFHKEYVAASTEQQDKWLIHDRKYSGVEKSDDMRRFLWNEHFAMVAGDTVAFEAMPPLDGSDRLLHRDILGLWGCPIGELWYLEGLSRMCRELGRYTFFFTSLPLNVIGGVSSPPCAQALF